MNSQNIIRCEFSGKQTLQTHFHAEYELLYVLRGGLQLLSGESRYPLEKDDFCLINTGCRHSWTGEGNVLTGSILIDADRVAGLFGDTPVMFHCWSRELTEEEAEDIRRPVFQLFTYSRADEGLGRLLFNIQSYQLLYQLSANHLAKKNDPVWNFPEKGPEKRTYEILRYVNENYAQSISLGSLAEQLNLTTPYLSRIFKEQFGTTFLSYLQSVRLKHAANEILSGSKSLTRIALDSGFPNSASFIRNFKQAYGCTPSEYRKNSRQADLSPVPAADEDGAADVNAGISSAVRAYLDSHGAHPRITPVFSREDIRVSRHPRSVASNKPFRKPWQKLLNVGNAANLLRYDVREQVKQLRDALGFEYVYISNLLHPSMNIYPDSTGAPSFSEIRKVLDFVVSLGMHPYIELESQEPATPRLIDSHMVEATIRSQLEYLCTNFELLDSLISFLIRRYGQEELSCWRISMEQSTAINKQVSEKDYFRYFFRIAASKSRC